MVVKIYCGNFSEIRFFFPEQSFFNALFSFIVLCTVLVKLHENSN